MTKRRPEIISALHEFGRASQGNRRRNSCYAFMPPKGKLNLSLIRRHPVAAFWAYADEVGGITQAQKSVKAGEQILVEVHLYVPHDGSELRPVRRAPKRERVDVGSLDQDNPIPDRETEHWRSSSDL